LKKKQTNKNKILRSEGETGTPNKEFFNIFFLEEICWCQEHKLSVMDLPGFGELIDFTEQLYFFHCKIEF
jgi:hypothetical protein